MPNRVNVYIANELAAELRELSHCILLDFHGLTAEESVELRAGLRRQDVRIRVLKNSLALRAFEEGGFAVLGELLSGPCALVTGGEDMPSASRAISDWIKKNQKMAVRGGFADGRMLNADDVKRMADIPPMPVVLAQFIGGVQGIAQRVAGSFQGLAAGVRRALEEIRRQKEAAEGAPAADGA